MRRLKTSLLAFLRPREELCGLEVSEAAVRALRIRSDAAVFTVAAPLPPGAVSGGAVANPGAVAAALAEAHRRLAPPRRRVPAVLVLPAERIFAQPFTLPRLEGRALAEAIGLNLKVLSPLPANAAYAGAEALAASADGNRMELLGAFAPREVVDGFTAAAAAAGFSMAAVEFPARAIARVTAELGEGVSPDAPLLLVRLSEGGVELMIVRRGSLAFHELTPWRTLQGELRSREVSLADLTAFLGREVRRIESFYAGRWGGALAHAAVVAPAFAAEIAAFLAATFGLTARPLALRAFGYLPPIWYPVLGAALRGRTPRAQDRALTLGSETVHAQYHAERAIAFAARWRNAWLTLAGFFLLLALALDGLAARAAADLSRARAADRGAPSAAELTSLTARAAEWNGFAAFARAAQGSHVPLPNLFRALARARGERVALQRVAVDGAEVSVSGRARDIGAISAFKGALLREPFLRDVSLPPTSVALDESGAASFVATLTLE